MSDQDFKDLWAEMDLRRAQESWARSGYKVVQVIRKAVQLHEGWELDNHIWLVELEGGARVALTTSHGGVCEMEYDDLQEKIFETYSSLQQLIGMSIHWPKDLK